MAKTDLGKKRICGNCGVRFYDFNRKPIVCPKCETVFRETAAPAPAAARAAAVEEERPAKERAEFVSLEEAQAEQAGGKRAPAAGADEDEFGIDEDTLDDEDDETFIEEEEDGDDDVSGLIGGGIDTDDEEV